MAQKSLSRHENFASLRNTSPVFLRAQIRVKETEEALEKATRAMQDAFSGLWRRTEDRIEDKGWNNMDVEDIRVRLNKLEETESIGRMVPARPGVSPPVPPTPMPSAPLDQKNAGLKQMSDSTALEGKPGKKARARELLEDILLRLEKVETMKDGFDDRLEEFENYFYLTAGEEIDRARGGWPQLEKKRDSDGRLRGLAQAPEEVSSALDDAKDWGVLEEELDPNGRSRGERFKIETGVPNAEIQMLQEQVVSLKEEIQLLRSEKEKNNREVIVAVIEAMRDEYAVIAKKVCLR